MPFDERIQLALEALQRPIAEFRTTVEGALAQAEAHLATLDADPASRALRLRHELGPFAESHVDAQALSALLGAPRGTLPTEQERFRAAVDTLRDVLERGMTLFVAQVPPGGSLAKAVEDALARIGRAFGAVLAIELMRGGAFRPAEHDMLLHHFAFRSWTRTERRYAPPLVVQVNGADLHVGGLADFIDGRERIILVVQGECPPAALVRLISPGTFVLQTADATGLDRLAQHDGCGIAAMVPPTAARFIHDPHAGREAWQRLSVWHQADVPKHAIGGFSPWQMAEDTHQLAALATAPAMAMAGELANGTASGGSASAAPASAAPASAASVDALANWLLRQSDLGGIA